ncbi:5-formyltetrahydrofolate cyclo-ligase [Neisseriaceae bacterium B1]
MPTLFPKLPLTDKVSIRRQLRQNRKNLSKSARERAEQAINRALKRTIKRGKKIAVYYPIGSELRLDNFIQSAQKRGAQLYLPYIEKKQLRLWFTPYPNLSGSLKTRKIIGKTNRKSINVPQFQGKKIRAHQLNTLIIPIVGIDTQGYRLGQGGGYYDCTLAACQNRLIPRLIAVSFACQTVHSLPTEPHDAQIKEWFGEYGRISLPFQAA